MTIEGRPINELGLRPPLVSVVVISWNYARFIGAAIDSIRRQDYPYFDCLVIDNGSTDDSLAVISRHIGDDPRFSVLPLDANHGTMGAFQLALDRSKAEFVTLLDADDHWFSNFLSCHVQVHLALPLGIALTSSRVVEIDSNDQIINGSNLGFRFSGLESGLSGVKPSDKVPRVATILPNDFDLLKAQTTRIDPEINGWFWSPGSANVYRRNVLNLARPERSEYTNFIDVDIHFNRFCHILGGSAVIDRALSAYRMHDTNASNALPSMSHMRTARRERAASQEQQRQEILRLLLTRAESFSWIIKDRYWRALDQQSGKSGRALNEYYAGPVTYQIITEHLPHLIDIFGAAEVRRELAQRMPPAALRRMFGELPLPSVSISIDCNSVPTRFLQSTPLPPLVSVVLVSSQRASDIAPVIDSLRIQDYTRFECIIVVEAPSDDRFAVIARHVENDERFTTTIVGRDTRPTTAVLHVFQRLRGEFVSYVTNGEVLSSNFLSMHVQVHLALPKAVGFTAHEVVETATDGSALGPCAPYRNYAQDGSPGLRSDEASLRLTTINDEAYRRLSERTKSIPNNLAGGAWRLGPCLFRRTAIATVLPEPDIDPIEPSFELYFKSFCDCVFGSAIIDLPLTTYRIDVANAVPAVKIRSAGARHLGDTKEATDVYQVILRKLLACPEKFNEAACGRYWQSLDGLARQSGDLPSFFIRPNVVSLFVEFYGHLVEAFGEATVLRELRKRYRAKAWRHLVRRAHGGRLTISIAQEMCLIDALRIMNRATHKFGTHQSARDDNWNAAKP